MIVRAIAIALVVVAFLLAGCIHMQRPSQQPRRLAAASPQLGALCDTLGTKVLGLNLGSIVAGGISGGASTASSIWDNDIARYTLGGTAALLALGGGITSYLATYYAAKFARSCP